MHVSVVFQESESAAWSFCVLVLNDVAQVVVVNVSVENCAVVKIRDVVLLERLFLLDIALVLVMQVWCYDLFVLLLFLDLTHIRISSCFNTWSQQAIVVYLLAHAESFSHQLRSCSSFLDFV